MRQGGYLIRESRRVIGIEGARDSGRRSGDKKQRGEGIQQARGLRRDFGGSEPTTIERENTNKKNKERTSKE